MAGRASVPNKNNIACCLIVFLIVFVQFFSIAFTTLGLHNYFLPNPPEPLIKDGEFPIKINFTVNGEMYTKSDIFVCEYQGFELRGMGYFGSSVKKQRKWNGYIRSTGEESLVLYEDDKATLICDLASPGYFMGDKQYAYESDTQVFVRDAQGRLNFTEEETALCYVQVTSLEIGEPIENKFRYTLKSIFAWVR